MSLLRVVGLDPSLNNWGIATGLYCMNTGDIKICTLNVICPIIPKGKQVRQNSKDIDAASQLALGLQEALEHAQAVFVEVPVGSQSSRAMASYGICIGILGACRVQGIHMLELTPSEVKIAAVNSKTATKQEMINWAVDSHPKAPWPYYKQHGQEVLNIGKAEHMADAVATIYAGVKLNQFQLMKRMLASPKEYIYANTIKAG